MIVWLNGTFGVGKTTTSELLAKTLPDARVFDAEKVGTLLIPVEHFVLHAQEKTLVGRIETDPDQPGSQWRLDHVETYQQALPWLRGRGRIVETDQLAPSQVAATITSAVS